MSERSYDIHGVGLLVRSEAAAVIASVDRRLQSFPPSRSNPPELRIEFSVAGARQRGWPQAPAAGRCVYEAPGVEVRYDPAGDVLFADLLGVRMHCDAGQGVAYMESEEFSGRALYVATHALLTMCLIELLRRRGRFNLHAACLEHRGRGVLIAGSSGVGKSTLAIALVRAGLAFLSDDMVYIEHAATGVRMLAFPDAVGVTADTAERFPELRGLLTQPPPPGFPKRLVRMQSIFEAVEVLSCAPRVLIFPELVGDRASRLVALEPGDALLRLVPNVMLTRPVTAQGHLRALAALLEQVACYTLESGTNVEQSVRLIVDEVARLGGPRSEAQLSATAEQ